MSFGNKDIESGPIPRPGIQRIAPYVQGESGIAGVESPIKLSSNESSLGPSEKAIEAYKSAHLSLNRYPDGDQIALRQAISEVHGLDARNIVCGNGSDELIRLVTRAYVGEGDEVLVSENGFHMCRIHALAQGGDVVVAPESGDHLDIDALLQRVTKQTRLIPLANPNNPTGTFVAFDEIERLHKSLPDRVVLLLDGAYAEYVLDEKFNSGAKLVENSKNVVMTRTFSKIHGLASLRIGWAYLSPLMMDPIQRIRTPFNASGPAMAAAEAAIRDTDFVQNVAEHNARWQLIIRDRLSELGLYVLPSVTNFYLIRFPEKVDITAMQVAEFLQGRGIIPRPVGGSEDKELRITIGSDHENEKVLDALEAFVTRQHPSD